MTQAPGAGRGEGMPDRVLVGRIVKPHGIRGEVAVEPLSDRPERFADGAVVYGVGQRLTVVSSRPHQGRLLVRFEEVGDRSAAERLRMVDLEAEPLAATPPQEGETYLASEIVGMRVVTEAGRDLGGVEAVVELPPAADYDLLEVARPDGSTWLLPVVDDYVRIETGPDGADRIVVVDPPEGLVEEG